VSCFGDGEPETGVCACEPAVACDEVSASAHASVVATSSPQMADFISTDYRELDRYAARNVSLYS
jgi:hypothetical protein